MSASEGRLTHREALAMEVLRHAGRLRLRVRGESMLPALWPGDIAEIEAASLADISAGDVVLALREGRFFLHRFLSRRHNETFLTRGDSMPRPDPEFPSAALLGRLVKVERHGQKLPVPTPTRPWSRMLGLLFCYCSPARRLALSVHHRQCQVGAHLCNLTSDLCNHPSSQKRSLK